MKAIVVYNSKTGFTKRYAEWIAGEIGCAAQPYKDFLKEKAAVDLVIFGSHLFAGKIVGLNEVKTRFSLALGEKMVVFVTGATPSSAEEIVGKVWADNLTEAEWASIPHFYMPGGINYEKMGFAQRLLLKTLSKILKGKKDKTPEEADMEAAIQQSSDYSDRKYIKPLVDCVIEMREDADEKSR